MALRRLWKGVGILMAARTKFRCMVSCQMEIEISDVVIAAVDDDWRGQFYKLRTPQEIANHIAFNIAQGCSLSEIDGFANLDDKEVRVISEDWDVEEV